MNYNTAVQYLLSFADFERAASPHRDVEAFKLDRIRSILARLDDPQDGRRTVHIAGLKGKGSTAALVESVLRAAGRRTGLYTSPHLHAFTERIRLDGQPISEEAFAGLVERLQPVVEADLTANPGRVTTFEMLTAMAFLAFRDAEVDVQILEVGLGGRLDTTNVVAEKDVAVVTALSDEHAEILGPDPERIAAEKAGIITPRTRAVVLGSQRSERAAAVVRERAATLNVPCTDVATAYRWEPAGSEAAGQWFRLHRTPPTGDLPAETLYLTPLLGEHQIENAVAAIAAVEALRRPAGDADPSPGAPAEARPPVPSAAFHTGLATVEWPGRLERLGRDPLVIVDGAHNPDSLDRALEALHEHYAFNRLIAVFGTLRDKKAAAMAERLGEEASLVITTRPHHPRAARADDLALLFGGPSESTRVASSVPEAVDAALAAARPDDLICVIGSLFVVAEAREYLLRRDSLLLQARAERDL